MWPRSCVSSTGWDALMLYYTGAPSRSCHAELTTSPGCSTRSEVVTAPSVLGCWRDQTDILTNSSAAKSTMEQEPIGRAAPSLVPFVAFIPQPCLLSSSPPSEVTPCTCSMGYTSIGHHRREESMAASEAQSAPRNLFHNSNQSRSPGRCIFENSTILATRLATTHVLALQSGISTQQKPE
jgi:hypothetical protein